MRNHARIFDYLESFFTSPQLDLYVLRASILRPRTSGCVLGIWFVDGTEKPLKADWQTTNRGDQDSILSRCVVWSIPDTVSEGHLDRL